MMHGQPVFKGCIKILQERDADRPSWSPASMVSNAGRSEPHCGGFCLVTGLDTEYRRRVKLNVSINAGKVHVGDSLSNNRGGLWYGGRPIKVPREAPPQAPLFTK